MTLQRTADLIGCTVQATDGKVGSVHDILFDDNSWKLRYLVIRSGIWLDERMVLVPPQSFMYAEESAQELHTSLSCEQIRQSTPLENDPPVYLQHQIDTAATLPTLWMAYGGLHDPFLPTYVPPAIPAPEAAGDARPKPNYDPHLRSVHQISGYRLEDDQGEAGQVVDLLVDNEAWMLRYVVIRTGSWFSRQQRLLTVSHIDAINWEHRAITTSLSRERIAASPDYTDAMLAEPAFENRLLQYYLGNTPLPLASVQGLPVFEGEHGSLLGTIDDLYLTPEVDRCAAVRVRSGGLFRQRAVAIPFASLQLIGEDMWLASDARAAIPVAQYEAEVRPVRAHHLIGRQVVTEGGTPIGLLGQVVLRRDGSVDGFYLQAVHVGGPLSERRFIVRGALITIGDQENPATSSLTAAEQSGRP